MKNLIKYLLALSLLSSAHLFGAAKTAKDAAFDALFETSGVLKNALTASTPQAITENDFVKTLSTHATQIANLININSQEGEFSPADVLSSKYTVAAEKISTRLDAFKKLKEVYIQEFRRFTTACKTFIEKKTDKNEKETQKKALIGQYVGNGKTKDALKEKYKSDQGLTVVTITHFIELVTLYFLASEEVNQETTKDLIKTIFSSSRHVALEEGTIKTLFTENVDGTSMKEFWDKQEEEDAKTVQHAIKLLKRLQTDVDTPLKKPFEKTKLADAVKETSKYIAKVVIIDKSLLKDKTDKETLQKTITNLQNRIKEITIELKTTDGVKFIKELTSGKSDPIQENLDAHFTDVQEKSDNLTTTLEKLAQLYFIAGVVSGVTLAMVKPKEGGALKNALDGNHGSNMRKNFFPSHAGLKEKVEFFYEKNPVAFMGLTTAAVVALVTAASAGVAYYKGSKNGLGTWKTIKKWCGALNDQDKSEIAAQCSFEQIRTSFDNDKKTADEIIAMKKTAAEATNAQPNFNK